MHPLRFDLQCFMVFQFTKGHFDALICGGVINSVVPYHCKRECEM